MTPAAANRGQDRPHTGSDLAAVLAEVSMLGPFFAVETHPADALPAAPWQPFTDLTEGPFLRDRILATRAALAAGAGRAPDDIEMRVAASVTQLGLVARLLSPAMAASLLAAYAPVDLDPSRVWWQSVLGGPLPLSVPLPGTAPQVVTQPVVSGVGQVVDGPVAELLRATERICPVSPSVLWGNVASAINGATTMIVAARPDLTSSAREYASELLKRPPLSLPDPHVGPAFRRRSCCLIYRIKPGAATAVCGDCVLNA